MKNLSIEIDKKYTYFQKNAKAYLFQNHVFVGLQPLWTGNPDGKIYVVA